jgi:TolB protein
MTPLTDLPTSQFHPAWSPDGSRIAFDAQSGEGEMQFHVMDEDGSNLQASRKVRSGTTSLPGRPMELGSRSSANRDGNDEIYVMNADGSGQARLTTDVDMDLSPTWSPDGSRIAFQSNRDGFNRIYVMGADGSGVIGLTDSEGFDPAWSADGTRIAFAGTRDGNPEIHVVNAKGSISTRLTHDPSHDWNPTWSPDDSGIASRATATERFASTS